MGHEGKESSLEDDICAEYIKNLIRGEKKKVSNLALKLKKDSGKYFFSEDQWQYPKEDFDRCLEIDSFNFAIIAKVAEEDEYAILTRLD